MNPGRAIAELRADLTARLDRMEQILDEVLMHSRSPKMRASPKTGRRVDYAKEIPLALERGESRRELAARLNVSYQTVARAVLLWGAAGGSPLRDERGRPKLTESAKIREEEVARAYVAGKTLREIGEEHRLSRERIRQILIAYEARTGESIQRHPRFDPVRRRARPKLPRLSWRCAGCGQERLVTAAALKKAPTTCRRCRDKQTMPSGATIERWIAQRGAGMSWMAIATQAGYSNQASHYVQTYIALYLRDEGRLDRIPAIWRGSSLRWLAKRVPELQEMVA